VVRPALASDGDIGLWPFDGSLAELLESRDVVICETYPADAYRHLGLMLPGRKRWTKREAKDSRSHWPQFQHWVHRNGAVLEDRLVSMMEQGFGDEAVGEDRFDATVGLMSMMEVVAGVRSESPCLSPEIREVEGWILGMA
jgi:hypothetical protein